MRIGILTYHCVTNFGAQLQCLSTIDYLRKHGYEPIVLNWFPQDLEDFYLSQHPRIQFDEQFNFAMREMPVTKLCRTLEELCQVIDDSSLDAIFLGSDALFDYFPIKSRRSFNLKRLRFIEESKVASNHDLPNPFWGSFNDYVNKRIPYCGFSVSSQNAPFYRCNKAEKAELKRLINNFSLITTRDEWTRKYVSEIGHRTDITITPDPVFAFNHNSELFIQKHELIQKYNLPENYILISFCKDILSDDYINEIIRKVEQYTNATCVSFPMPRGLRQLDTRAFVELPLPTLDWYYLIKYSQGYIGELMHPIIVSLHNCVPFFCFDQYGTYKRIIPRICYKYIYESSKIFDILKRADLLANVCPYEYSNKITPSDVVNSFTKFDKEKCLRFAESQYCRYLDGMQKVLSSLK